MYADPTVRARTAWLAVATFADAVLILLIASAICGILREPFDWYAPAKPIDPTDFLGAYAIIALAILSSVGYCRTWPIEERPPGADIASRSAVLIATLVAALWMAAADGPGHLIAAAMLVLGFVLAVAVIATPQSVRAVTQLFGRDRPRRIRPAGVLVLRAAGPLAWVGLGASPIIGSGDTELLQIALYSATLLCTLAAIGIMIRHSSFRLIAAGAGVRTGRAR